LAPLGGEVAGHKGTGLAIVAEIFASFVGDARTISQHEGSAGNAAAFVAIDPTIFCEGDELRNRIASIVSYVHDVEPASHIGPGLAAHPDVGLLPGEPEYRTEQHRSSTGIPLDPGVTSTIIALAADLGVTDSLPGEMRSPDEV